VNQSAAGKEKEATCLKSRNRTQVFFPLFGRPEGRPFFCPAHWGFFGNLGMPSFSRIVIMGHQLVKPDWKRFSLTKPVNQSQLRLTFTASNSDSMINAPAMIRSTLSMYMEMFPFPAAAQLLRNSSSSNENILQLPAQFVK
jgi:hypothetical protein